MPGGGIPTWLRYAMLALWLAGGDAAAQSEAAGTPPVSHRLSFPDLHQQYVQVESTFPSDSATLDLFLPVWTPGSYLVVNHDAAIQGLQARGPDGAPLPVAKLERDRWRIDTGDAGSVTVSYRAHAATLDVSESWVSPDFALLNAATFIFYTPGTRDRPQEIAVGVPVSLAHAYTALPPGEGQHVWRADDYDALVDNPLVLGRSLPLRFREGGQGYVLLNIGDTGLWSEERALDDVRGVVRAANRLWGEIPLEREYWFFNLLVEASGGLEHDHCTVMMASRWQMRHRLDYVKWLGLVAHEYLHVWNVRRMRPAALARYDFRSEQYSDALWLAEGITNYYDDLLLSRARVITPAEYLERLAYQVHVLELTPGRRHQSLRESSRDAWTRHYRPGPNTINDTVSYYVKGAVLGFVLDTRIRQVTGGRRSLDHVMRNMWAAWRERPYPDGAFADAVAGVAGPEVRAWLTPLIETPADPDVDEALRYFGLALERRPEMAALELAGNPLPAGFGINWSDATDALVVGAVVHGLSAAEAGILPGDELLAIGDERVTRATVEDRRARLRPGEQVEFLVARQGRLLRIPVTLGEARPLAYEIKASAATYKDRNLRRLEGWLGQSLKTR